MPFLYVNYEQRLREVSQLLGFTLHEYKIEPGVIYVSCQHDDVMEMSLEVVRSMMPFGILVVPNPEMGEFYGT